jgi:hypothetical protein
LFCRYDDGEVTHNIEATAFGRGGFRSHPNHLYRECFDLPEIAASCGSDLRAVTRREMLGLFVAIRSSHFGAIRDNHRAETGLLLARYLFQQNRTLYSSQMEASIERGQDLFDRHEGGHPAHVGDKLREWLRTRAVLTGNTINTNEVSNANNHHALRAQVFTTG